MGKGDIWTQGTELEQPQTQTLQDAPSPAAESKALSAGRVRSQQRQRLGRVRRGPLRFWKMEVWASPAPSPSSTGCPHALELTRQGQRRRLQNHPLWRFLSNSCWRASPWLRRPATLGRGLGFQEPTLAVPAPGSPGGDSSLSLSSGPAGCRAPHRDGQGRMAAALPPRLVECGSETLCMHTCALTALPGLHGGPVVGWGPPAARACRQKASAQVPYTLLVTTEEQAAGRTRGHWECWPLPGWWGQ